MSATVDNDTAKRDEANLEYIALAGRYVCITSRLCQNGIHTCGFKDHAARFPLAMMRTAQPSLFSRSVHEENQ